MKLSHKGRNREGENSRREEVGLMWASRFGGTGAGREV